MSDLKQMLLAQARMQRDVYGHNISSMTTAERAAFLSWNAQALGAEVHEAMQEFSWKNWASATYVNDDALFGELVDCWIFVQNMLLAAAPGASADELSDRITAHHRMKLQVNRQRQEDGYDGVSTKDASGRAMDEPVAHRSIDDVTPGEWDAAAKVIRTVVRVRGSNGCETVFGS